MRMSHLVLRHAGVHRRGEMTRCDSSSRARDTRGRHHDRRQEPMAHPHPHIGSEAGRRRPEYPIGVLFNGSLAERWWEGEVSTHDLQYATIAAIHGNRWRRCAVWPAEPSPAHHQPRSAGGPGVEALPHGPRQDLAGGDVLGGTGAVSAAVEATMTADARAVGYSQTHDAVEVRGPEAWKPLALWSFYAVGGYRQALTRQGRPALRR